MQIKDLKIGGIYKTVNKDGHFMDYNIEFLGVILKIVSIRGSAVYTQVLEPKDFKYEDYMRPQGGTWNTRFNGELPFEKYNREPLTYKQAMKILAGNK